MRGIGGEVVIVKEGTNEELQGKGITRIESRIIGASETIATIPI